MPSLIYEERIQSRAVTRTSNGSKVKRVYHVNNDDPEWVLYSGLLPAHLEPHPSLPNLFVDEVTVEPPVQDGVTCRVIVIYKEWPLGLTPASENWSWDIGAESQLITSVPNSSYAAHYPAASDVGLAIGSDGEQTAGVSVYRPTLTITVSKIWGYLIPEVRLLVELMTSTTNVGPWMDYDPGEVLFNGVKFRRQTDGTILATYGFRVSRWVGPQTIELFDTSTVVINPWPHDYVWYRFLDQKQDTGVEKIVQRGIQSVHVNQVYNESDFHLLGLVGPY